MPSESAVLLDQLGPHLLVATAAARERLNAWQERAQLPQEAPEALRERIRSSVAFYGDLAMLPAVVEAFASAPAAVRETLLVEAVVVGTGWSTRGWSTPAIAPGPAYLIVVAGGSLNIADVTHTVHHELAHVWLMAPRPLLPAKTAHGQANVRALAEAEEWSVIPDVDARHAREERLAEALAVLWSAER